MGGACFKEERKGRGHQKGDAGFMCLKIGDYHVLTTGRGVPVGGRREGG